MKNRQPTWRQVRETLANAPALPTTTRDDFWRDFNARSHLYPQESTAPRRPLLAPKLIWGAASFAAAALVALLGFIMLVQPTPAYADFAIHSYEIGADHSSVMLLQDSASQATILWITDLQVDTDEDDTDEDDLPPEETLP